MVALGLGSRGLGRGGVRTLDSVVLSLTDLARQIPAEPLRGNVLAGLLFVHLGLPSGGFQFT